MKVGDIMTREVAWCRRDTDLGAAARRMLEGRLGTLPVVDEHGRVSGMVTDRDIAMAAALRRRDTSHIAVNEAMTERVRLCSAEDDVATALKRMEEARVRRLPVVDGGGHLVGILSIDDVVVRGVGPDGITAAEFVTAMQRICSQPALEPEVDMDVFTGG